jgi:hypothetical protein
MLKDVKMAAWLCRPTIDDGPRDGGRPTDQ